MYSDIWNILSPVSERSTPDYTIYQVILSRAVKLVLVEAKTDKIFTMDAVAQVLASYPGLPPLYITIPGITGVFSASQFFSAYSVQPHPDTGQCGLGVVQLLPADPSLCVQ